MDTHDPKTTNRAQYADMFCTVMRRLFTFAIMNMSDAEYAELSHTIDDFALPRRAVRERVREGSRPLARGSQSDSQSHAGAAIAEPNIDETLREYQLSLLHPHVPTEYETSRRDNSRQSHDPADDIAEIKAQQVHMPSIDKTLREYQLSLLHPHVPTEYETSRRDNSRQSHDPAKDDIAPSQPAHMPTEDETLREYQLRVLRPARLSTEYETIRDQQPDPIKDDTVRDHRPYVPTVEDVVIEHQLQLAEEMDENGDMTCERNLPKNGNADAIAKKK